MDELSFENLLIVVVAGFAAPFALGLVPRLRLPAVVLEIVLGIALGPSVLGWVEVDGPVDKVRAKVAEIAERGDAIALMPPTYFLEPERIAEYQRRILAAFGAAPG